MTDTPLVDTIARAIRKADTKYSPLAPQFDDDWMPDEGREDYRDMARAALAAMPQPIGYGVLVRPACDFHPWVDERHHTTQAHAADEAAALRVDYPDDTHIVVALVPVGGAHA